MLSPYDRPTDVAVGLELGGGAAYYLTSGFALTGELSFGMYFGDRGTVYPNLGVGIGVLIDWEVLP